MSAQIKSILEFKKQKETENCNEAQKKITLDAYKDAIILIADIILKLPSE